jgi:hypothetical protein
MLSACCFALCLILHTPCIASYHSWLIVRSYTLGDTEPELVESMEQAHVEEFTNLSLDHGKPRCI